MDLQENIQRIKEVMGLDNNSIYEYFDPLYFLKNKLTKEPEQISNDEFVKYKDGFKKLVDITFKLTQKQYPLKHLKGYRIKNIYYQNQWLIDLCPIVDDWFNWYDNNNFLVKLDEFARKFKEVSSLMASESPYSSEEFNKNIFYSINKCRY